MQTELIKQLNQILKDFPEYWEDETLQRSVVINDIKNKKPDLIKALINKPKIKELYSSEVDGVLIFDFESLISLLRYKEYWANSFTKYRNSVGLTSEGKYLNYNTDVVLDFPFKDCVLEGGMTKEEQGKNEIYYNEKIARDEIDRLFSPKVLTNAKRYTKSGIEENITEFNDDDNLIIKGNNLIALHTLKERYAGKIKLIYIDPPYNTGNDGFKYNDRFNHSTWLTFMKNRLEVAKELLSDDGLIFIQCDYNEDSYLKVLMDELFSNDKFVAQIVVKSNSLSGNKTQHKNKTILKNKDTILCYKKTDLIKINPQYTVKDNWDTHYGGFLKLDKGEPYIVSLKNVLIEHDIISAKDTIKPDIINNQKFNDFVYENRKSIFQKVGSIPDRLKKLSLSKPEEVVWIITDLGEKMYAHGGRRISMLESVYQNINGKNVLAQLLGDLWTDIDFQNTQNEGGLSFTNGKKPEALIKRIIDMSTQEGDLVLDFHLGSGTTAVVAHKMRRRYIGIEQMDYINDITVPRLQKVIEGEQGGISKDVNWQGGGSFVYAELMELNYHYIHDIQKAQNYGELVKLFERMKETGHLNYQVELDKILTTEYEIDGVNQMVAFSELALDEQKQLLIELLDKNQLYVNACEMNDSDLNVSELDKTFTNSFYGKVE
ncbi:DNA methyltransferase [Orbus mooreae]|uniref:DNA methyltransferase n=1 Tax=Orbus mooreae TaxID=3074107 RepID=UPI00370D1599